jgi:hypothetical protein
MEVFRKYRIAVLKKRNVFYFKYSKDIPRQPQLTPIPLPKSQIDSWIPKFWIGNGTSN